LSSVEPWLKRAKEIIRPQCECSREGFKGLLVAAEAIQRGTAIVQHVGMVRLDRERPVEAAHRFRVIALRVERQAEIGPGIGRTGLLFTAAPISLSDSGRRPR
jgi:hypothetical protein